MVTLRVVLSIATSQNWYMYQMDMNNVFLQGGLQEKICMEDPQGFDQVVPIIRRKKFTDC